VDKADSLDLLGAGYGHSVHPEETEDSGCTLKKVCNSLEVVFFFKKSRHFPVSLTVLSFLKPSEINCYKNTSFGC